MQIPTRSRGPAPDEGAGAANAARPTGLAARFATLHSSQAGLDAETRLRRLLLALVVPELVVALVLLLAGAYVGVVVAVLAAAVQVGAALVLVPGVADGAPRAAPPAADRAVISGQGEEIAALRAQLETADAGLALQNELARRQRELLLRQLARIDALEADEADPAALGELFALDHLATRMRRYSEGALLIAGSSGSGTSDTAPVPASEVLRGAVAEIEDFHRVDVSVDRDVLLAGGAAVDLVHLLAELIENATVFSASSSRVRVHGHAGEAGYVVTIADEGVGISPERTAGLHALLTADSPGLTPGRLGYQLVARLARRQGLAIDVLAAATGATVSVALPPSLVVGGQAPAAAPGLPAAAAPDLLSAAAPAEPLWVGQAAAVAGSAVTIPEAGDGLGTAYPAPLAPRVAPPVPAVAPEPAAAETVELPAYVPAEADLEPAVPEAVAAVDSAQVASAAEAGLIGVNHAPDADWAGLPLPIELLDEPSVLPYDLGYATDDEPVPTGLDAPVVLDDNVVTADFAAHAETVSLDPLGPPYDLVVATEPALSWLPPTAPPSMAPSMPPPMPPPMPPTAPPSVAPTSRPPMPPVLVPAQGPVEDDLSLTDAGLARRTPQTHMAPQMVEDYESPLPDDVAAVAAPDRSRSLLSAYRDGLVLGRGGLTPDDVRHHIDDRQQFGVPDDETGESR